MKKALAKGKCFFGAGDRTRTDDLRITNALLYQLSHTSIYKLQELLYIKRTNNARVFAKKFEVFAFREVNIVFARSLKRFFFVSLFVCSPPPLRGASRRVETAELIISRAASAGWQKPPLRGGTAAAPPSFPLRGNLLPPAH